EVTIIFRQGENIVNYDKYEVLSHEIDDTTGFSDNFLAQQRYLLKNGKYDMEFIISDINEEQEPYITTDPVTIDFPVDKASISGIELISDYAKTETPGILTKSGFDLYPYVFNFYPESVNSIMFYCEFYNTDKQFGEGGKFVYNYHIQSFETKSMLKNYSRAKVGEGSAVIPIMKEIDIRELPSGNYFLIAELRDQDNEVVTMNRLFFQRSNPNIQFDTKDLAALNTDGTFVQDIDNIDTLRQYIHSLLPIATEVDRVFISRQMKDADIQTLKQYFLNFWTGRDNVMPEAAWNHYYQQVRKVNYIYSTPNRPGYDTDRGRVFLKYGPPNIISESYNEPAAYPYEIWQYYSLGDGQRNKKFVFYTIDIVINDFQLVHSDAIGEVSNYRWQVEIYKRTFDPYSLDQNIYPDAWGSNVNKYWENPR
ncbi:MAG: GWxTD domain-containing protein, partial [Bacteroidales bacterium]|nr:GWxTD domain-containing protein [Bacteroidales bacterium]